MGTALAVTVGFIFASLPLPPAPARSIADAAHLLSTDELRAAEDAAQAVEKATGARIRVLTLADGGGVPPKDTAVRALNEWQAGTRSVVLLIQMNPRELYLQPGTDLAEVFDEPTASSICAQDVAPRMRSGDSAGAVLAGITSVGVRLQGGAGPPRGAWVGRVMVGGILFALFGGLSALVAAMIFLAKRSGAGGGGDGSSGVGGGDGGFGSGFDSGGGGVSSDGSGGGGSSW